MWSDNESTEDLLGFQYLASAVVSIVHNENLLPATIGVFGDWGGVQPELHKQLQDTHRVDLQDAVTVIPASDTILQSTQQALDEAEAWLAGHTAS